MSNTTTTTISTTTSISLASTIVAIAMPTVMGLCCITCCVVVLCHKKCKKTSKDSVYPFTAQSQQRSISQTQTLATFQSPPRTTNQTPTAIVTGPSSKGPEMTNEQRLETARNTHEQALNFYTKKLFPEALSAAAGAVKIRGEVLGINHPDTQKSIQLHKLIRQEIFSNNPDGSNETNAIVLPYKVPAAAILAQTFWLNKHYPMYKFKLQALLRDNEKRYDLMTILTIDGEEKNIYFDVTQSRNNDS